MRRAPFTGSVQKGQVHEIGPMPVAAGGWEGGPWDWEGLSVGHGVSLGKEVLWTEREVLVAHLCECA